MLLGGFWRCPDFLVVSIDQNTEGAFEPTTADTHPGATNCPKGSRGSECGKATTPSIPDCHSSVPQGPRFQPTAHPEVVNMRVLCREGVTTICSSGLWTAAWER